MAQTEISIHAEIVESLRQALVHLDQHALHVPAAQLQFIIECLEQHVASDCNCSPQD